MNTWAIGDIQGCWGALQALLRAIAFEPERDRIWLVGDLVNRGPESLEVLRWARAQGDSLVSVLGNHELHLLAIAEGIREPGPGDPLDGILEAPDRDAILTWVTQRPLIHRERGHLLVHAGLDPSWTTDEALRWSARIEALLQSDQRGPLLRAYRGGGDPAGGPLERAAVALQRMTRMRTWGPDGEPDFSWKGPPTDGRVPWFEMPSPPRDEKIIAGHWAALGLHDSPRVISLDTGCVWGRELTAWNLDTGGTVSVPNPEKT